MSPPPAAPLNDIFAPGGPLSGLLPAYEPRESQAAMAAAVHEVLIERNSLLVEAGTGTGKSLAYLIPALEVAGEGDRGVVATHTIALQQQLLSADIPLALAALGTDKAVALLQGRSNYLCLRKLHRQQLLGLFADEGAAHRQRRLLELSRKAKSGDRGELPFALPRTEWLQVAASTATCAHSACPFHGDCFYQRARRKAQRAALVITNHALLLVDSLMRLDEAQVLPDYGFLIVDEAHRLEDSATSQFARAVSLGRLRGLTGELYNVRRRGGQLAAVVAGGSLEAEELTRRLEELRAAGERHFADLDRLLPRTAERRVLQEELETDAALADQLSAVAGWLREAASGIDEEDAAEIIGAVGLLNDYLSDLRDLEQRRLEGFVYWARRSRPAEPPELHAAPVEVGPLLDERLWSLPERSVATSATLTVGGAFDYLRSRLSFPAGGELRLPGAFDYRTQAAIYLPRLPDPRNPKYYEAAAAEVLRLARLVERGGTLVLCTSYSAVNEFHRRLGPELEALGRSVLVQGDLDKNLLLRRFREAECGVLIATATFWEGVDLPGDQLRLLVIAKLPFAVPSDPVVQARSNRLERRGVKAFFAYSVPEAALRLRQGVGRLIRSRTDRGVVAVLDSRLLTKRYGRTFIDTLPPLSRLTRFDPLALGEFLD